MIIHKSVKRPISSANFVPESTVLTLEIDLSRLLDKIADVRSEELRSASNCAPTRKDLRRLACRIYDGRRTRDRMIARQLFGEPAWDMLLTLYCSSARGDLIGVTSLSHAADVPLATGHRWQVVLADQGMIERGPAELDLRRQNVRLTSKGRTLLEAYLTRLFLNCNVTSISAGTVAG